MLTDFNYNKDNILWCNVPLANLRAWFRPIIQYQNLILVGYKDRLNFLW